MPQWEGDAPRLLHSQQSPVYMRFLTTEQNSDTKQYTLRTPSLLDCHWHLVACGLRASLGLAALNLPGFRTVDVVGWNPLGVIGCCGGNSRGAFIGGRGFGAFGAARGSLLAGLAALALLREVGRDPNSVKEVGNTNEAGQEEEVQENAVCG